MEPASGGVVPPLRLEVQRHGATRVVACAGEVDLATVSQLRTALTDEMLDGPVDLVIDLSKVTFMDSSGLGALVGAHRKARLFQGRLTVVATSSSLLRLLTITGLDRVLTVVPSVEEALARR